MLLLIISKSYNVQAIHLIIDYIKDLFNQMFGTKHTLKATNGLKILTLVIGSSYQHENEII